MLNFFRIKKRDKPVRTVMITSQGGFRSGTFLLKITKKELKVFRKVYERSSIDLLIK